MEKQAEFVSSLENLHQSDPALSVAIIWRREHHKLKYEVLQHKWDYRYYNSDRIVLELCTYRNYFSLSCLKYCTYTKKSVQYSFHV